MLSNFYESLNEEAQSGKAIVIPETHSKAMYLSENGQFFQMENSRLYIELFQLYLVIKHFQKLDEFLF